ncbi:MAG: ATP-grasp domain-containing protein [Candidatus Omnitrophica bacterium]|nr:ATP-grasp domain-containing protein [Candidatus Omnitrophota bacterium]
MDKKLKVLLVFDCPYVTARGYDFAKEFKEPDWDTQLNVYEALLENGHEVSLLGVYDDASILIEEVRQNKPDVVFNIMEGFRKKTNLERNAAWLLEMLNVPFTGANPAALLVCNDKALSKKILSFHKIRVPNFHTFHKNRKLKSIKRPKLPAIVKPLCEEASVGISQASVVDNEAACLERIKFIHEKMNMDAIVEEYVPGREFYVSVIGHKILEVLPIREMKFGEISDPESKIATYKAKWDDEYRKKWGIQNVFANNMPEGLEKKLTHICKTAYRALNLNSYARFDMRVSADGRIYALEVNANPCLAKDDEIAQSADKANISYGKLIQKILSLALNNANNGK